MARTADISSVHMGERYQREVRRGHSTRKRQAAAGRATLMAAGL
jgi:hypothetical protein